MSELLQDPNANLAATRFVMWWAFLLTAAAYGSLLWQTCRWRFWAGAPFNRALMGWSVEAWFLAAHQSYWWAVEHYQAAGNCRSHDAAEYVVDLCRRADALREWAPYITPVFYAGILVGIVLILPPIIVTVTGWKSLWTRIGVKLCIVAVWFVGLAITRS